MIGKTAPVAQKLASQLPLVTICTPTFNRRPFIPYIITCFKNQTYPRDRMEWVVIDDGTDKVGDLFEEAGLGECVKYISCEKKLTLGRKRNMLHDHSKGDILVYMDDDDYYPPERVAHAVDVLTRNKKVLCAGSSELHVWFGHISRMVQFGPYSKSHATAGTFAFKRKLLETSRYDEGASLAEEKHFLKNYTVPFAQLDPKKTILVFSHSHNTFDKKTLLENMENDPFQKYTEVGVDSYVTDPETKRFFMEEMEGVLDCYEPGKPAMKPDVMAQIEEIRHENLRIQYTDYSLHCAVCGCGIRVFYGCIPRAFKAINQFYLFHFGSETYVNPDGSNDETNELLKER